jgi:HD-GYP domain-containing protein (c-di-GMP phosphodiesterase class II)
MLKQIPTSALELGMYVHKFEGNWFDHPFWRAKFLLADTDRLEVIRASKIDAVVIDTSKGRDLAAATPAPRGPAPARPAAATGASARIQAIKQRTAVQVASTGPVSMAQEIETAGQIADKARDRLGKTFMAGRLGKALDVRKVEPVVSDILASVRRNPQAFSALMRCKLKNELVFRHALSVSALMVALADRMKLPAAEIHNCGLAGLLLDIGVNFLPYVGDPPGGDYRNLSERIWKQHVLLGHRALENDGDLPQMVLDACLYHHERIDGRGYPQNKSGAAIPQVARMAAICDSFDFHLTASDRSMGLDPATAIEVMRADVGAYDEDILHTFIQTVGFYPVGSFVELASSKLAMVVDEDPKDPMRPVVQVFFSLATRERIAPHRIALADPRETERIVGIADMTGLDLPPYEQLRQLVFLSACRNTAEV